MVVLLLQNNNTMSHMEFQNVIKFVIVGNSSVYDITVAFLNAFVYQSIVRL